MSKKRLLLLVVILIGIGFAALCVFLSVHRATSGFWALIFPAGSTELKVGDVAPDFELSDQNGQPVRLSALRDKKNVVLAFYVKAFTVG